MLDAVSVGAAVAVPLDEGASPSTGAPVEDESGTVSVGAAVAVLLDEGALPLSGDPVRDGDGTVSVGAAVADKGASPSTGAPVEDGGAPSLPLLPPFVAVGQGEVEDNVLVRVAGKVPKVPTVDVADADEVQVPDGVPSDGSLAAEEVVTEAAGAATV